MRVDDGGEFLLLQLLDSVLVISKVQLGAHQDDGSVGAVVSDLRVPLRKEEEAAGQMNECWKKPSSKTGGKVRALQSRVAASTL